MNALLKQYLVDVEFPEVSGAELLEMLQVRDRLAEIEPALDPDEREALHAADSRLLAQASAVSRELSRFIDLQAHRQRHEVPPSRWWWFLDVVSELPIGAANT